MAFSKKTKTDTSTSFVAAYDAEVDRLNTAKRWCSAGRSYPYTRTVVDGKQAIQAPRDRAPEMQLGLTDDDLTDSATQAINYLRGVGQATSDDEAAADEVERVTHRPRVKALYPV